MQFCKMTSIQIWLIIVGVVSHTLDYAFNMSSELCCLLEEGERCINGASTVSFSSFSKKMKSLAQKKEKLVQDQTVKYIYLDMP